VGTILQNAVDVAGEMPVRRAVEVVEHRQKSPEWERTRGFVPRERAVEPMKRVEEKPLFNTPAARIEEDLPKRVQLVPAAAEKVKAAPVARPEEPFMFFEETPGSAPIHTPAAKATTTQLPSVQEEIVKQELPMAAKIDTPPVVEIIAAPPENETADEKAERVKREAVARVRARFGMPEEAVEALTAAMAKPMPRQEPAFEPMVAFRPAQHNAPAPTVTDNVARTIAAEPVTQASLEVRKYEEPMVARPVSPAEKEITVQQPEPVARPLPAAAQPELPPVRRVTVQQERPQTVTPPAVQWALQPERRRVPRDPIVFPRGLNKAALRMLEKGQTIAKGQAGPSLTAAEQAVANKISSTQHPVAARPVASHREESTIQDGAPRWNLLRRFGAFDADEQDEQNEHSLQDRAAG